LRLKVTVRSSLEWVWWNERVRVSFSAVASWTAPAPASSSDKVRTRRHPARYRALGNDSELNWRAKPASTMSPPRGRPIEDFFHHPEAKEGVLVQSGRVNRTLRPTPEYRLRTNAPSVAKNSHLAKSRSRMVNVTNAVAGRILDFAEKFKPDPRRISTSAQISVPADAGPEAGPG
jgi:hypothetical protein